MSSPDPRNRRPLPFDVPAGGVADANDLRSDTTLPVASPSPTEAAGPASAPRSYRRKAVIVGPSRAGKTSLLMAIYRACSIVERDGVHLHFVADRETAPLVERAIQIMVDEKARQDGTQAQETYRFEIAALPDVGARQWLPVEPMNFEIDDGPGGALFPSEPLEHQAFPEMLKRWRQQMITSLREADAIVLCVNADTPDVVNWETNIVALIAEAASELELKPGIMRKVAAVARREPPPEPISIHRLKAKRVLVLLTRADRVCSRLSSDLRQKPPGDDDLPSVMRRLRGMAPGRLAPTLEPISSARGYLGETSLVTLRRALHPDARFAVGICSAGGFTEDGEAYWNEEGKPQIESGDADKREDILKRWMPWGVRDALYFMATGKARGVVRIVRDEDLIYENRPSRLCRYNPGRN